MLNVNNTGTKQGFWGFFSVSLFTASGLCEISFLLSGTDLSLQLISN